MKRIWLLSRLRFSVRKLLLVSGLLAFLISSTYAATASRGGVEEIDNSFTVGFTFRFGEVSQLCSGSLLSPTLIITARHCVYSNAGQYGTDYIFSPPGTQIDAAIDPKVIPVKVKKLILDTNFQADLLSKTNDIAFIQLDKSLATKGFIKPATKVEIDSLETNTVSGFGYGAVFETGAKYSIYPRRYNLEWKISDSSTASSSTFSIPSKTNSACKGDSGGPIVATLTNGQKVLVGVLSGAADVVDNCGSMAPDGNYYMRITKAYPFLSLVSQIYDPNALATALPTPTKKKVITCVKGKIIKKITGTNPKCPTGYKKK